MHKFSLLILCAGFGKRMLDLTEYTPKPLLKFRNKILLGNSITFFQDIGCNKIFINSHYLHNKIKNYVKANFENYPIDIIYEPLILGTGGAVKNIFKYTENDKICVVNSDIFWTQENKLDIKNFLKDFNEIEFCKILLSKKNDFYGLKRNKGDFKLDNSIVSKWKEEDDVYFYSGLQIVSKSVFKNTNKIFSMNEIWNRLIVERKLIGSQGSSKIIHIGDKYSFHNL